MAHAYTPGLKVTDGILLRKKRILPLKGEVAVKVGDTVTPDTVVARTDLPGAVKPVNAANILGVPPSEVKDYVLVEPGKLMAPKTVYAEKKSFFGLFKTRLVAEDRCMIESINPITGNILLRAEPIPVEVTAYISGTVVEVFPEEGVTVETWATQVQGIFGIGGETHGKLITVVPDNHTPLTPDRLTEECRGKIVVGGNLVTAAAVRRAIELGVHGLIAGGLHDKDLRELLGYDLGVAITGNEEIGTTLMITEGFGEIDMAERTFRLLKSHEGEEASLNGATQIRAGVIRPEVVISRDRPETLDKSDAKVGSLHVGDEVRVIRAPYFGRLGRVTALPAELQKLESETKARVLEIEFPDGQRAIIPRANVEMIEA
jgi:hypothetical protein